MTYDRVLQASDRLNLDGAIVSHRAELARGDFIFVG